MSRASVNAAKAAPASTPVTARRRLVDVLDVQPGHRVGFLDDAGGGGVRLAGELLSRQSGLFLYGVVVGKVMARPSYVDECFELIIAATGRRNWPAFSRALSEVNRLLRPGGTVALTSPNPQNPLERALRRLSRTGSGRAVRGLGARARSYGTPVVEQDLSSVRSSRDQHDVAVGQRLADVFGSAVRIELSWRVVWRATRPSTARPSA